MIKKLLEHGANPNATSTVGESALSALLYLTLLAPDLSRMRLPCMRLLLEHGDDPNASNRSGMPALMMTVHLGMTSHVRLLLKYADPDTVTTT
jgi:ankyrin repeat protein